MSNRVRELVAALTDTERGQLLEDYDIFERDGAIGDCALRTLANTFPNDGNMEVWWMISIANEIYRFYAKLYLRADNG